MEEKQKKEISCPSCQSRLTIIAEQLQPVRYCPICSVCLSPETDVSHSNQSFSDVQEPISFIHGHIPEKKEIIFEIGPYQVLKSIGKGGMGEVLLAYDTSCGRRIALKRIRTDLAAQKQLNNRFLKEARVTSQLTHPAIIPIYAINNENGPVYYTMPFVEGDTLKQILRNAQQQCKSGMKPDQASSIPALIRIFLSVCQAIAYAHSKSVLHRDLKPENIIVGRYGEVLILDWGLAKLIRPDAYEEQEPADESFDSNEPSNPFHELTHVGKAVGTVTYMAPERALGQPATFTTDIYSLGVILYQLLTLRSPFQRGSLKEFRKSLAKEVFLDPMEVAPYRDIPKMLSQIARKCLAAVPEERYQTVDELLQDVESYIEGRSEWFQIAELDIHRKSDWEFQENVLIAEHMAITRGTEVSNWVNLMISKLSFPENTKIEAKIRIGNTGKGIGLLLSIPEASERIHLNSGYCLWLASDLDKSTKLLRATVEVMFAPEIFMQRDEWYRIRLEKVDHNIHFYLNDILQFSYVSHLPLIGTHIGLLARDADFTIKDFSVSVGSQSIKVNCLAVPDAFLAHKDYATALSEYRRIGYSFPGTAEGREGMFRAGITLLEEGRSCSDPVESTHIYEQALNEFGKLQFTPGAPLGYLGKALTYQALGDYEEEIKCFELAYRRYPSHPLLTVLQEQIVYRMHECSHAHRRATYQFVLLAIRHLPTDMTSNHTKKLFTNLLRHWEPLYFIDQFPENPAWDTPIENLTFATQVAFWLAQPYTLLEIIGDALMPPSLPSVITGALYALLELGCVELAAKEIEKIALLPEFSLFKTFFDPLKIAIQAHIDLPQAAKEICVLLDTIETNEWRSAFYLMETGISLMDPASILVVAEKMLLKNFPPHLKRQIDCYRIWAYLLDKNWEKASDIFAHYPLEYLTEETSLLYFLYGCWLYHAEGKEIASIHFNAVLDVSAPRSWSLFNHFFNDQSEKMKNWLKTAFLWEKRQFYRQNVLFFSCVEDSQQVAKFQDLERQTYLDIRE